MIGRINAGESATKGANKKEVNAPISHRKAISQSVARTRKSLSQRSTTTLTINKLWAMNKTLPNLLVSTEFNRRCISVDVLSGAVSTTAVCAQDYHGGRMAVSANVSRLDISCQHLSASSSLRGHRRCDIMNPCAATGRADPPPTADDTHQE